MEGYCLQDWRNIDKAGNNRSQVEGRQLSLKQRDKSSQATISKGIITKWNDIANENLEIPGRLQSPIAFAKWEAIKITNR